VEDSELQARVFIRMCKNVTNCSIVHETDGKRALGRLARGEKYDIVISDVCMPGMDGIAFFHAMFLNKFNEQATANIAVTATPTLSRDPVDATIHRKLSDLTKDYNVLVYDKNHGDKVNLARDVIKPLLESKSSVDNARIAINLHWNPWDYNLRSPLPEMSPALSESSVRSGDTSVKSAASSLGDMVSTCMVEGTRVRSFYARKIPETERDRS